MQYITRLFIVNVSYIKIKMASTCNCTDVVGTLRNILASPANTGYVLITIIITSSFMLQYQLQFSTIKSQ